MVRNSGAYDDKHPNEPVYISLYQRKGGREPLDTRLEWQNFHLPRKRPSHTADKQLTTRDWSCADHPSD